MDEHNRLAGADIVQRDSDISNLNFHFPREGKLERDIAIA
jgi:hypothetical protein